MKIKKRNNRKFVLEKPPTLLKLVVSLSFIILILMSKNSRHLNEKLSRVE
jgi:hypothetical protein